MLSFARKRSAMTSMPSRKSASLASFFMAKPTAKPPMAPNPSWLITGMRLNRSFSNLLIMHLDFLTILFGGADVCKITALTGVARAFGEQR